MPFIATWPGKISPGTTSQATINFTDFFATFAELTDARMTNYTSATDSHSFLPALLGGSGDIPRPAMINGSYSIRQGSWKLSSKGNKKSADVTRIKTSPTFAQGGNIHHKIIFVHLLSLQKRIQQYSNYHIE